MEEASPSTQWTSLSTGETQPLTSGGFLGFFLSSPHPMNNWTMHAVLVISLSWKVCPQP